MPIVNLAIFDLKLKPLLCETTLLRKSIIYLIEVDAMPVS